jgi:hypothetical protein
MTRLTPSARLAQKQAESRERQLAAKRNAKKRKRTIERREIAALLRMVKHSMQSWS